MTFASAWDASLRLVRGLGVAGAIAFFWSVAFVLAWVVVPYVFWRDRTTDGRRRRLQRIVAGAFRWFLRNLERATLYRCRHTGVAAVEGPAVLVANHPSLLDVTGIIARMPHTCCVVKSSLARSPLVGRLLRALGHIEAGDGSLTAGLEVLETLRARLDEGYAVLVFPEGTRSPPGGLHRFRRGAFAAAKRAGVPVVPLFLRCDPPALGKATPVWRHPRRCPTLTVDVGTPIDTRGVEPAELCNNVQADFRMRLSHAEAVPGEPPT